MIFFKIVNLSVSSNINDIGVFLSGIGTIILSICALKSLGSFKEWQRQKQFDKRSDIAEEALNRFDLFKNHFDEWVQFADSWFVFNRQSEANSKRLESLNEDEQIIFIEECDKDPYELTNYLKKGISILDELSLASSKIVRLQDPFMVEQLEELCKALKDMLGSIAAKHFSCVDSKTKDKAIKSIKESLKRINDLYESVHASLVKFVMFKE